MRLLYLAAVIAFSAAAISAQSDYKKAEFFAGFSHGMVDGSTSQFVKTNNSFGDIGPLKFNGFNAAGVYNFSRYVGVRGDVSGTYNGGDLNLPITPSISVTGEARNSLYNVLGGVQFKDNASDGRFKPFGHVLVGVGFAKTKVNTSCVPSGACNPLSIPSSRDDQGAAGAIGGGIDIRLNDRFDLRVVQFDYNPVSLDSGMLHNARVGFGIVIK